MNIFITGATGFIGSNLINALMLKGFKVYAHKRNINSKTSIILNSEPNWIIKDFNLIDEYDLLNIDVIIHLAAVGISPRIANIDECMQFNYWDTLDFINLASKSNVKNFIVTGTFAEYGLTANYKDFLETDDILRPIGPYAISKAMLSLTLRNNFKNSKIGITYLRLFSVFGEGQYSENLWPQINNAAKNDLDFQSTLGEQIRDFIHVDLVCQKIIEFLDCDKNQDSIHFYNVGTGKGTSVRNFTEYWWSKLNAKGKIHFGAIPYRQNEIMRMVSK